MNSSAFDIVLSEMPSILELQIPYIKLSQPLKNSPMNKNISRFTHTLFLLLKITQSLEILRWV